MTEKSNVKKFPISFETSWRLTGRMIEKDAKEIVEMRKQWHEGYAKGYMHMMKYMRIYRNLCFVLLIALVLTSTLLILK